MRPEQLLDLIYTLLSQRRSDETGTIDYLRDKQKSQNERINKLKMEYLKSLVPQPEKPERKKTALPLPPVE